MRLPAPGQPGHDRAVEKTMHNVGLAHGAITVSAMAATAAQLFGVDPQKVSDAMDPSEYGHELGVVHGKIAAKAVNAALKLAKEKARLN